MWKIGEGRVWFTMTVSVVSLCHQIPASHAVESFSFSCAFMGPAPSHAMQRKRVNFVKDVLLIISGRKGTAKVYSAQYLIMMILA
jgi:hypothetical protein